LVNIACPPLRLTGEPRFTALSEKVTVPPAVYPAPLEGESAAVRITDCPGVADAGAMFKARLVVNMVPVRLLLVEELAAAFESPG
jgi:hypothetical protein